jgi:amidase
MILPAAAAAAKGADLCFLAAVEMQRLLRRRQISARDLLEAHIRQIERVNPKVNAIVTLTLELAREQARRADESAAKGRFLGPLHGLPIAHKDLVDTKGVRTTYGSPIFRDHVPERDVLMVERVRAAGAILVGKTNTPEFGAGSQTFNPVFGATRNPYDLSKTCGGSSGGAAVALACGMLPIADGSDTGGSLRNPAAFCNVVGMRPSPGRVPRVPAAAAWSPLSVLGPMARTAADAALLLSAIAGPDPRAPLSIDEPGSVFAKPLDRDFKGVRVAWCPGFGGLPVDRRVRAVIDSRRKAFESLGCLVEEATPDFAGADEAFRVFRALSFYQQRGALAETHRPMIKATVLEEIDRARRLTGPQVAAAELQRSRLSEKFAEFMRTYEFLALPVTQVPPFDVEQQFVTEIEGVRMESYIDWMRSCYYITMTSHPAVSVPAGFTPEGLPVGLQIVGRRHDDRGALQLAHAFERETRVGDRRPAIAG